MWTDEFEHMMAREMEDERHAVMATPGDAHREWHANSGVPMGQPGCPQDACHPADDFEPEPGPGEGIRCAHCKGRHWAVADVKVCARMVASTSAATARAARFGEIQARSASRFD